VGVLLVVSVVDMATSPWSGHHRSVDIGSGWTDVQCRAEPEKAPGVFVPSGLAVAVELQPVRFRGVGALAGRRLADDRGSDLVGQRHRDDALLERRALAWRRHQHEAADLGPTMEHEQLCAFGRELDAGDPSVSG